MIYVKGKIYTAHRLAWLWVYGILPTYDIDHINRVKTDNSIKNLRDVPTWINMQNTDPSVRSKSGLMGIYSHKNGKFKATIRHSNKQHHLRYFETASTAHEDYLAVASEYWEINLRFPKEIS